MRVGVVGGGQLGMMLAQAAQRVDVEVRLLDPNPHACGGRVAPLTVGDLDDPKAIARFAEGCDVLTYEFENVPCSAIEHLDVPIRPSVEALRVSQDRLLEKSFFRGHAIATPEFRAVSSKGEFDVSVESIGLPCVFKTRRHGYDGRGQAVARTSVDLQAVWRELEHAAHSPGLICEGFVPFDRELSIVCVRALDGSIASYPLVENEHKGGILHTTIAPAPNVDDALREQATAIARRTLEEFNYVGVCTIELFQLADRLLVNEMAPRVHNSGHWTIEGARTSQFENHIRAICGMELGPTDPVGDAGMLNLVGGEPDQFGLAETMGAYVHIYGKAAKPGRKLGHVTVVRETADDVRNALRELELSSDWIERS